MTFGLCQCGCGQRTPLATRTNAARGHVKGQPFPRLKGHRDGRSQPQKTDRYRVQDRGYDTPCWIWQLLVAPNGYGRLGVNGQKQLAHRHYYEMHKGPIPEGLQLDHLCRQRDCVNPDHLEPVTNQENALRGAKTKLTDAVVREIRERLRSGVPRQAVADQFDLTRQHVGAIERGQVWADA